MDLHLSEYAWATPRRAGEGLRVSCTRYLPRGVKKQDYARGDYLDVWLPALAPSVELLRWAKKADLDTDKTWREFARRYRAEMAKTEPRQVIQLIAMLARNTPVSVGCACHGPHCHRFELVKLIRSAHAGTL